MANIAVPRGTTDLTGLLADTNQFFINEGDQNITLGLDYSSLTEGFAGGYVGPGFTGNIGGGASGALKCDFDSGATATFDYAAGGGSCTYRPNGDNNLCNYLFSRSRGRLYLVDGGTVTDLHCASGYTSVGESVVVTTLLQSYSADVKIGYNATVVTTGTVSGGSLNSARGFTTLNCYGGSTASTITLSREVLNLSTTPAVGTLNIYNCAVKLNSAANVTTVNLFGPDAMLDLSGTPTAYTITTLNCDPWAYKRSKLKSMYGVTITISTTNYKFGPADAA